MIHLASPIIGEEEVTAVTRVLRSGMLAQGPEVAAFEQEFADQFDTGNAIAVSNGTLAIALALQAVGIEPGDEVIVPSFTFAATANAVVLTGGVPVFADCERASFCIDPAHVASLISPRTRAIVAVHLYGHMAAMSELAALADTHGLHLIEDAAQAHGAMRDGLPVGALSDMSTYSFYPTKNMTTGEGGMVTSRNPELAETIRLLRNHGMEKRYHHERIGMNARMTDIGAAIGRVQLRNLGEWNRRRREIAATYDKQLVGIVTTPEAPTSVHHVYHQYTIRTGRRDHVVAACSKAKIGCGIYYPIPCHRQSAFTEFVGSEPLPETDTAAAEVLSIPVRPDLTETEITSVINAIVEGEET